MCNKCGKIVKNSSEINIDKKENNLFLIIIQFVLVFLGIPLIGLVSYGILYFFGYLGIIFIFPFVLGIFMPLYYILLRFKFNTKKSITPAIIIFICIFVSLFIIWVCVNKISDKKNDKFKPVQTQLYQLYSDNYEIIDKCDYWNSGGENKYETIIKIGTKYALFDYYINYNYYYIISEIDGEEKFHVNNSLNKYLNIPFLSYFYHEDTDLILSIIIQKSDFDINSLASELKLFLDEAYMKYDDYKLKIYLTDKIDKSLNEEYRIFMISQMANRCDYEFENKFNKNLVYKQFYISLSSYGLKTMPDVEDIKFSIERQYKELKR